MKIVSLQAENVKRLKAVRIKPDGAMVVVGGKNDNGKSSVLDSIAMALGGNGLVPAKALRNGQRKGVIEVDVGDYVITRKFSRQEDDSVRSTLEIKTREGAKVSSPQKILDDLCGRLAFDPVEFLRLKPKDQLDALKELVGLDFTAIDKDRQVAFDKRTEINRQVKAKDAELSACPQIGNVPEREISVAALTDDLSRCDKHNQANAAQRRKLQAVQDQVVAVQKECTEIEQQILTLQSKLSMKQEILAATQDNVTEQQAIVAALVDEDAEAVREQLKSAEITNRCVRQNEKHGKLQKECEELAAHAASLTEAIEAFDKQKAEQLAAAKFPVAGLGFDANGVTFNGLPFDKDYQSSANMIRVAAGMAIALNNTLRVMMIRDGSLLDENSLAIVAEMAEQNDMQIWIEVVKSDETCSVIISDGEVLEPAAVPA